MRKIFFVFLAGCAADTSKLEARVHDLEIQVAELRGRASITTDRVARTDRFGAGACVPIDDTVPHDAKFPNPVTFDLGHTNLHSGDSITIREVRGTSPEFAKDQMYLVRGEYTLASADTAELGLNVTGGCTQGNVRGRQSVKRGTGTFELATRIVYVGQPHVTFYVDGNGSGGVYFGKGDFLYK